MMMRSLRFIAVVMVLVFCGTTMALPKTCMNGVCAVCPEECDDIQVGRFSQEAMESTSFDWVRDACVCLGCEGQSCQMVNNETLASAAQSVGDGLERVFDETKQIVPDALETAYNATKEGLDMAKDKTRQGLQVAYNATKEGLDAAKENVPDALETAANATKQGLETAYNATKEGLETAAEKTTEGLETAGDAISNAFNTVFG